MTRVAIRPALLADARAIGAIHVRSWQAAYQGIVPDAVLKGLSIDDRETAWRGHLEAGASRTWLAEDDQAPLGWVSAAGSRDAGAQPSTAEIWALYVDPGCWRRGVGRALYEYAAARLSRDSFLDVTLWVLEANTAGRAFYEALGFVADPEARRMVNRAGTDLAHIRLRRQLPGADVTAR